MTACLALLAQCWPAKLMPQYPHDVWSSTVTVDCVCLHKCRVILEVSSRTSARGIDNLLLPAASCDILRRDEGQHRQQVLHSCVMSVC